MGKAHFEVEACLDQANKPQRVTISIDRENDLVELRPHRRKKVFTFPLSKLAEILYQKAVILEMNDTRKPRRPRMAKRGLLAVGR